ncbi:flagellar basal-body MS-ring/collar protein FliF [Polycladidibacter hongkongensis]|uniref:flagellar basal-body MS-ring/collar protein FliF n=1 Tax=Polycladidibacter hongkongensis TaxID=1647556 RepID=UPI00082A6E6E|nr:flagellar basal-body MS-ring/collar protein FliF [Pseudovibrio hongkongensis]
MNGFFDFLKRLGPARLGAMGAMAAILVGVFAFIIMRATAPQLVPLYTDLSLEDSSAIVSQLQSSGTVYEIRENGAALYVPQESVHQLRLTMAGVGLPSGGGVGYEIFDKSDTLGATSFVQNINRLRALEGELARTIRSISRVVSARVHLVIPEKQLFQRDREPPTASIAVKVRGSLDSGQIRSIQHLVASAVEGLEPSYVSIVDERGALLAAGTGADDGAFGSANLDERRISIENRMRAQVEDILNNVVGSGRARVRVAAELNLNRKTETEEVFDPNGQVVRSSQSREENQRSSSLNQSVTVSNQLPDAGANDTGGGQEDNSNVTEETVNYEISRSTTTEVIEAGGLERLSIAVLVDGTYVNDESGAQVYQPRSQEELDSIAALVRSAVGFDERRGDKIEVVNLRFIDTPVEEMPEDGQGWMEFTRADIMRLAELGVLLVISVLMLVFAVNPLMRRILASEDTAEPSEVIGAGAAVTGTAPAAGAAVGAEAEAAELGPSASLQEAEAQAMQKNGWIADAKTQAALHSSSIKELGNMIDEMPTEAVNIVRSWINEAA